jgi:phospholipid transport system substrate-binding protein
MRVNKILLTGLIISFSWLMAASAYAQSDPVAMLQGIANRMIAGLRANKATLKTKPQIVYNLAYRYVVPYADLPLMARRVLPAQTWNSATPAQRAQFQKEFTTTLIRTYASALASYQDQTVRFFPVRGSVGNSVEVNSEIDSSSGQPIQVSYSLTRAGGGYRLIDLSVEGVSMLESFRAQYADILSQGSMDVLLRRMSSHNRR